MHHLARLVNFQKRGLTWSDIKCAGNPGKRIRLLLLRLGILLSTGKFRTLVGKRCGIGLSRKTSRSFGSSNASPGGGKLKRRILPISPNKVAVYGRRQYHKATATSLLLRAFEAKKSSVILERPSGEL